MRMTATLDAFDPAAGPFIFSRWILHAMQRGFVFLALDVADCSRPAAIPAPADAAADPKGPPLPMRRLNL